MHFDDRLATVLKLPANGGAIARIQFRQLVDILGRAARPDEFASSTLDAAWARLDELRDVIPSGERAGILREPSLRLTSPEIVSRLAAAEPDVASAAMAAADLAEAQWLALIPELPIRARGILRHRRDFGPHVEALLAQLGIGDRGLPPAAMPVERSARPELVVLEGGGAARPNSTPEPSSAGIGAIVRRIEAFRAARATSEENGSADALRSPVKAPGTARAAILALDFTTDAEGRVNWSDGVPGVIGTLLSGETASDELQAAMRHRQPLRAIGVTLAGAPALAGTWRLDALPRFGSPDGRFTGYVGRLRRSASLVRDAAASEADSMRQILHELRTPANAIQIAAEIIQQQLYGPAPHEYRALAAAIAGDTAQILAGFEELDRLVKLETGVLVPAAGECDLAPLIAETVGRLDAWTNPRGSGFAVPQPLAPSGIRLDREEAARLVWRLLAALAGATAPGETLAVGVTHALRNVVLTIELPLALARRMDEAETSGRPLETAHALSAGMFGIGFTLRLARAEAKAAGGELVRAGTRISLALPGLTPGAARHTQS